MTVIINGSTGIDASTTTQSVDLPKGTTAQRPSSPEAGAIRYNTTTNQTEVYSGIDWVTLTTQTYSINYLIIAGGGGGYVGGGGAGTVSGTATAGTANTGGGGGGGSLNNSYTGAAGGSGVVIVSYAGAQKGTGGTVTSSGGNTIHTFTSSGTFTA